MNEFIKFMLDRHMVVFGINDAIKVLNASRGYAKLFVLRCIKKGIVGRVERGVYYLKGYANEYAIASNIIKPSYVSLVSALAYYGLTTQIPRVVYVVSPKRHRVIRNVEGYDIIFKHAKKELMFGYHKELNGNIFIADPEKAIVDIYYFRDLNDLDEDALKSPPRISISKLIAYAKQSRNKYVVKKVAELLRMNGHGKEANELLNGAEHAGLR